MENSWVDNLLGRLFDRVEISIGGDVSEQWYCSECYAAHGRSAPPGVCGADLREYNEEKHFRLIAGAYDEWYKGKKKLRTIEEFRKFSNEDPELLEALGNEIDQSKYHDVLRCKSKRFSLERAAGNPIGSAGFRTIEALDLLRGPKR